MQINMADGVGYRSRFPPQPSSPASQRGYSSFAEPGTRQYEAAAPRKQAGTDFSYTTETLPSPLSPISTPSPQSPLAPWPLSNEIRNSPRSAPRPVSRPSDRPPSNASSHVSAFSLYPPPSKPLPPLPPPKAPKRASSQTSFDKASIDSTRFSQSSGANSIPDRASVRSSVRKNSQSGPGRPPRIPERALQQPARINVEFRRKFEADKKKKTNTVHYLDLSVTSSIVASKHGKNSIRICSVPDGAVQSVLKFQAYTEPQSRSREYLIRSHAILSEPANLIAIATKFGTSVEVWNWADKKSLQSIDNSDRWTGGDFGAFGSGWSTLAVYHGAKSTIDLYGNSAGKKPLSLTSTIDLRKADLPFLIQYPELALSATSPMLVAAAGPRPPRPGHPPPDRETLLVAWDIRASSDVSSVPYMIARPWEHIEIETAIPCELAAYGSNVVSIWIPASYRIIAATSSKGEQTYNLSPVPVPNRYVLVWDLTSNETRTFRIPNTTSCISPDCRFVAYCHASTTFMGGRGSLVILDVITGKQVWSWPDPNATEHESVPRAGFEQFDTLSRVTELEFSGDGKSLVVGDREGQCCVYNILPVE